MENLRLSPQARLRITAAMEHPHRHGRYGRPAVMAAVLAVALTVTALAAGARLVFFPRVPEDVAETLQPVERSTKNSGIVLTVQSASVEGGRFRAYVTMKDELADRLNEGSVDMLSFDLSTLALKDFWTTEWRSLLQGNYPCSCGPDDVFFPDVTTGPLNYDEESGTYGFLLEVSDSQGGELEFTSEDFHLEVYSLCAGQEDGEASLSPAWPDAGQEAETAHVDYYRYKYAIKDPLWVEAPKDQMCYRCKGGADLLAPGQNALEIAEDFEISAIGWVDGKLHVQQRCSGKMDLHWKFTSAEGQLLLTRPDGTQITPDLHYKYWGDDNTKYYEESVYDISPEELAECTLGGSYRSGGKLITGCWCLDFSLDDSQNQS